MNYNSINQLIDTLILFFKTSSQNRNTWYEALLASPALVAAIGALAAFLPVHITNIRNKKDKEKERIQNELKEFYNPLLFLLKRQTAIYEIFNPEDKNPHTLELLLDGYSFSDDDSVHLEEIMSISAKIKKLVEDNPGYISRELMDPLVKLIGHYDILKLAKDGQLTDREEYKNYVYPREIDSIVEEKVKRLNEELAHNK